MSVAQQGVQAFTGPAMRAQVSFAMQTVFSHWQDLGDGKFASKNDLIQDMQKAGYFVILLFGGLTKADVSVLRVESRAAKGGHGIADATLRARFSRTRKAISEAENIADASVMLDNSRDEKRAFTACRVQLGPGPIYDTRNIAAPPKAIAGWLSILARA